MAAREASDNRQFAGSNETMTRPFWKHVIGILGGLGPHAHIEFESLLLDATGKALGSPPCDQDYPPWVVSSMPTTPDRTRALLEGSESPIEAMVERAVERVGARGVIGLLAASGTLRAELYQKKIHELAPETRVVSPLDLPNG